jgi:hypothetical protein
VPSCLRRSNIEAVSVTPPVGALMWPTTMPASAIAANAQSNTQSRRVHFRMKIFLNIFQTTQPSSPHNLVVFSTKHQKTTVPERRPWSCLNSGTKSAAPHCHVWTATAPQPLTLNVAVQSPCERGGFFFMSLINRANDPNARPPLPAALVDRRVKRRLLCRARRALYLLLRLSVVTIAAKLLSQD